MTGHFLVLESLAGILPAAGRTDRAMRDRHAVAGAEAGEIPALHTAGKTFAGRSTGDVDILTDDKMVRRDLGTHRNKGVVIDAEFGELALGLDLGDREVAAVGFGRRLHLALAGAELKRDVAVLGEETRHPDLLCENSGAHLSLLHALQLDLDVDAGGEIELHKRIDRLR